MTLPQVVTLTIRDAELNDAPKLAALMGELGYQTTSHEMRKRLKSILSDARYRTLVAENENEICGMIGTLTHVGHEHNEKMRIDFMRHSVIHEPVFALQRISRRPASARSAVPHPAPREIERRDAPYLLDYQ